MLVGEDGAKWASGENTAFRVDGKYWVNNHAHVLRPHRDVLLDDWLVHFLNHSDLSSSVSGLTVPKLNQANLREILIPVPPLSEQQRIMHNIHQALEGIAIAKANTEKNLKNAQALFESYLRTVFAQNREGWQTRKLGEVCDFLNRGVSPKYLEQGGICVLNQKCIRNHKIYYEFSRSHDLSEKKVAQERFIQLGDVLVNSTGTGTLGRVAQVREHPLEPTTVDSHVTIVRPKTAMFHLDFFGYMMIMIEESIKNAGEGCGGQTELARSILAQKFSVSFPDSISEQQIIVAKLDALAAETQRLESIYQRKLDALEALKKSLLAQAFAGNL